ncbi:3-oxoacyl-[acyl-carrier-protein] synthase III C-terminal domain-containing protein [Streptococcus sp. H31]|uniref:3-oxoacyl-[acyl-carrier-protein] synthase III C-terminal domain-containing protein n=1 Tax=Streptococcus huangxiaojuni TaxID=3237239 RepID=UPI0034A186D1
MRKVFLQGYGTALPKQTVHFGKQTRYRISPDENQLDLAVQAARNALTNAKMTVEDIDCIVSASAVGIQPIPCTAALIHEQLAKGTDIPALDINTTCTSFITALDLISYPLVAGRYHNILIVSSEVGSLALNPKQKESFELFSDGAAAMIFGQRQGSQSGIIDSIQKTWSEGAHATEIRAGLSAVHPEIYSEATKEEFMFDMKGKQILSLSVKKLPQLFHHFLTKNGMTAADLDFVIPHQASRAMPLVMEKLGIKPQQFIDLISEYGNMVSASVPFAFCQALRKKRIQKGDKVLLMGTAAGLTTNMLLLQL